MIGQLRGLLLVKKPNQVLLDVQGVGYEVHIPLTSFYELPAEGNEVLLRIHTHVREDALLLFGFVSQKEKDLFLKLISISGIGPKLAISILSGGRVDELALAVANGNIARLTTIPGVGRKTAERVILELKGQMAPFLAPGESESRQAGPARDRLEEDILSALVNLGYPKSGAEKALAAVKGGPECERTFEELLRRTLRQLAG
jgi:holliday junction DNA helicase RuvA